MTLWFAAPVVGIVGILTLVSQQTAPAPALSSVDLTARAIALAEIKKGLPNFEAADFADVKFDRVESRAIPSVAYWWAFKGIGGDGYKEVAVATLRGSTYLLATVDDWAAMARAAAWSPSSASDAVEACAETVQISSPVRSHVYETSLFREAGEAQSPGPVTVGTWSFGEGIAKLPEKWRWTAPVAKMTGTVWEADFWMAEWGVFRYRCQIGANTLRLERIERAPSWFMGHSRPGG